MEWVIEVGRKSTSTGVLSRFEHFERIDGDKLVNGVTVQKFRMSEEDHWKDGLKEALDKKGMNLEQSGVSIQCIWAEQSWV